MNNRWRQACRMGDYASRKLGRDPYDSSATPAQRRALKAIILKTLMIKVCEGMPI